MRVFLLWLISGATAYAGDQAGKFDYYVLSLSWSPTWCALEGDASGAEQCDPAKDRGWVLHGLWPQYDRGWPEFCQTAERPPLTRHDPRHGRHNGQFGSGLIPVEETRELLGPVGTGLLRPVT